MIRIRDSFRIPGRIRATYWILILCILSFMASSSMGPRSVFFAGGVIPADFFNHDLLVEHVVKNKELYLSGVTRNPSDMETVGRILESGRSEDLVSMVRAPGVITLFWAMFLHAGIYHLFSNMIGLYIFGPNVEAHMGKTRFLLFFFACGVVGFLCQILFSATSVTPIVGCSGAISGLFGAYMALFPKHYIRISIGNRLRPYRDIMFPVKALIVMWFLSQVFYAILPSPTGSNNIAFLTHIGGFVCGMLIANGRPKAKKKHKFKVYTD